MVSIVYALLKEIVFSMVGKLALKVLLERFSSRLVVYGLEKLKSYSTNDVTSDTVQDIIDSLKGRKLKVIDAR